MHKETVWKKDEIREKGNQHFVFYFLQEFPGMTKISFSKKGTLPNDERLCQELSNTKTLSQGLQASFLPLRNVQALLVLSYTHARVSDGTSNGKTMHNTCKDT